MSIKRENICRLCLKVVTNEFTEVDGVIRQMFDILLLKLDVNIIKKPIICRDCVANAKKSLTFKLTCFGTERTILLLSAIRENTQHDIKITCKEKEDVEMDREEDLDICRICMTQLERNNFAFFNTLRNEMTMFNIFTKYMLEMDFSLMENPKICTTCRENLNNYLNFVTNCLEMEQRIKSFCENRKNYSMDQVYSGYLQQFLCKDSLEHHEKSPQVCANKEVSTMFEDIECVYPGACDDLIKLEELDIKQEKIDLEFPPKEFAKEANRTISLKPREGNTNKWSYRKKFQGSRMEDNSNQDTLEVNENENSCMQINNSAVYTDENKEKNITIRDLLTNLDASETDIYNYTLHAWENMQQNVSRNDTGIIMSHGKDTIYKIYKCSFCAYKTKFNINLQRHVLVHKDVSEIKMYKCSSCAYQAKYKDNLRKHMLVHPDLSNMKMQKCPFCAYETKVETYLRRHMLVHKDVSEIKLHKCPLCAYETKHKPNLTKHMLVHKDVSEITMHKCSLCTYEAKQKGALKRHILVHKDVSEIKMHKCSLCAYQAKLKYHLKKHLLMHKDVSEIKMHKCSLCAHETKYKHNLRKHILVHKDVSEVQMHKCSFCAYEAKQKRSLKHHMSKHKDVSEITKKYV